MKLNRTGRARLIGAAGDIDPRLYGVGPSTRVALWEIIAVPDIRYQVAELAGRLARELAAPPSGLLPAGGLDPAKIL